MTNYLTVKETCEVFKISRATLYRELKKGLPHVKVGSSSRFVESEVYEYYKNKMRK